MNIDDLRNIVNERNRIVDINVIPDKEFLKMVYGDGDVQMDWYEMGYQMAAGIIGTGEDMSPEAIWEDVYGWTLTLQWEHEVGEKIIEETEKEIIGDDKEVIERTEFKWYLYMNKKDDWIDGYYSWIVEHVNIKEEIV